MRIAVAYDNGQVFQHFGHTEQFKIYDAENGKVVNSVLLPTGGSGHGALAALLAQVKADMLICGGIGGGARAALMKAGIMIYPGVIGMADQAVEAFLAGTLRFDPDTMCKHHHEGEHDCGTCGHRGEDRQCRHGSCGE